MSFRDELRKALRGTGVAEELSDEQFLRLESLDQWITRWSKRLDLVGFRSREERVQRYFAEAIAAARFLPGKGLSGEALDVGSGGGSPALPLAIVRPAWRWTLVESRRKKCIFLDEAVRALGLDSVRVLAERFERLTVPEPVDAVSLRGIRMSESMLERVSEWLRLGGRVLWFSSLERLEAGSSGLHRLGLKVVEGPIRLLSGGRGAILVLEKTDHATVRNECFT